MLCWTAQDISHPLPRGGLKSPVRVHSTMQVGSNVESSSGLFRSMIPEVSDGRLGSVSRTRTTCSIATRITKESSSRRPSTPHFTAFLPPRGFVSPRLICLDSVLSSPSTFQRPSSNQPSSVHALNLSPFLSTWPRPTLLFPGLIPSTRKNAC